MHVNKYICPHTYLPIDVSAALGSLGGQLSLTDGPKRSTARRGLRRGAGAARARRAPWAQEAAHPHGYQNLSV